MTVFLVPLVLAAIGLAAGVLVGTLLGGLPLLLSLPDDRYVHAHGFFATRYDPFMPACLLITAAGDAVMAVVNDDVAARVLFGLGAVLAAAVITVSLTVNVPINKWIVSLDPERLPPDWSRRDPRRVWGTWNRVRSVLAVLALVANCLAVVALLQR